MKQPRIKLPKHLDRIRELPCLICKADGSDACHVRYSSGFYHKRPTGMGEKPHDFWVVPLCRACHTEQHSMNERDFWDGHARDPLFIGLLLYAFSGNHEMMYEIVEAH